MKKTLPAALLYAALLAACENPQAGGNKDGPIIYTSAPADVTNSRAASDDGQLSLRWTDPDAEDLDHIEIIHNRTGGAPARSVPKGTGFYVWEDLTNGAEYTFTLRTVDGAGNKSAGVTVSGKPEVRIGLDALAGYLAGITGTSAASPETVRLAVSITISNSDTNTNGVWARINNAVQDARKYVILDLSAAALTMRQKGPGIITARHRIPWIL